jgi:hypothetical protein
MVSNPGSNVKFWNYLDCITGTKIASVIGGDSSQFALFVL